MPDTVPKLVRLDKMPQPDSFGIADSPVGFVLAAWQGPLLVRLHVLPAGAENRAAELFQDWGWITPKRDDGRAKQLTDNVIFPKRRWTGRFPATLQMGFYGTDLQFGIMRAMLAVPHGKTISYGGLARAARAPRAARAAGSVCARNPLPFIVPCHRILAANGLGGYGYGTALKRQFLDWETTANKKKASV